MATFKFGLIANGAKTLIQTHLTYIANAKKLCYIKQQSHSSESTRSLTSVTTAKMTSVMGFDGVTFEA